MTLFGDEDEQADSRNVRQLRRNGGDSNRVERNRSARSAMRPLRSVAEDPWASVGHGAASFLHLTQTHDRGYPVWHATYGQTGVTGLDCPLQLAAKCCREAVKHMERDRECAAYVLDGDGLSTGVKREGVKHEQ